MRAGWDYPAECDEPDPPECDVEDCNGDDECECECHKQPDEPDGYQSEADLQAITDHYYPV